MVQRGQEDGGKIREKYFLKTSQNLVVLLDSKGVGTAVLRFERDA